MMNDLVEGFDYKFTVPEDSGIAINVELLSGDYTGTVYRYGKVSFEEKEETGEGYLVFEYDLVDGDENLKEDINFKNHIGNILTTIISKNMENISDSEVVSE